MWKASARRVQTSPIHQTSYAASTSWGCERPLLAGYKPQLYIKLHILRALRGDVKGLCSQGTNVTYTPNLTSWEHFVGMRKASARRVQTSAIHQTSQPASTSWGYERPHTLRALRGDVKGLCSQGTNLSYTPNLTPWEHFVGMWKASARRVQTSVIHQTSYAASTSWGCERPLLAGYKRQLYTKPHTLRALRGDVKGLCSQGTNVTYTPNLTPWEHFVGMWKASARRAQTSVIHQTSHPESTSWGCERPLLAGHKPQLYTKPHTLRALRGDVKGLCSQGTNVSYTPNLIRWEHFVGMWKASARRVQTRSWAKNIPYQPLLIKPAATGVVLLYRARTLALTGSKHDNSFFI